MMTMKVLFTKIPESLYNRVRRAAKASDLKLVAVVRQALELWLKENGA